MWTLSQAAKNVNASKSTIQRAIKSGRLSAVKSGNSYEIEPSELFRVFPKETSHQRSVGQTETRPDYDAVVLKSELAASKEINAMLECQIDDLKHQRDEWKEQAKQQGQTTQRLLEDHRAGPSLKSFFQSLFNPLNTRKRQTD